MEFLKPYILVESDAIGCPLLPWFGPFGQFEQMILDDHGPLWHEKPDILWLSLRIQDVDRHFVDAFAGLEPGEAEDRITAFRQAQSSCAGRSAAIQGADSRVQFHRGGSTRAQSVRRQRPQRPAVRNRPTKQSSGSGTGGDQRRLLV